MRLPTAFVLFFTATLAGLPATAADYNPYCSYPDNDSCAPSEIFASVGPPGIYRVELTSTQPITGFEVDEMGWLTFNEYWDDAYNTNYGGDEYPITGPVGFGIATTPYVAWTTISIPVEEYTLYYPDGELEYTQHYFEGSPYLIGTVFNTDGPPTSGKFEFAIFPGAPEPQEWILILLGFVGVGSTIRKRHELSIMSQN